MDKTSNIKHHTSEKPRFSVIMPLHNKAPFVRKALESIASQTYRDFELIIIDDGSTDNSAAICDEFFQTFNHSQAHSINVNRSFVHSFIPAWQQRAIAVSQKATENLFASLMPMIGGNRLS